MSTLPYFDAATVRSHLPWDVAIEGIEQALQKSVDPEADSPRLFAPTPQGEFLMMPASTSQLMGVKVLTISPHNPERGLEKIQGTYLLFDSDTSAPLCVMDGTEVTSIRTPAITLAALRAMAAAAPEGEELPASPEILVFGVGVQGKNHIRAAHWAWPQAHFKVVGRNPQRIKAAIGELNAEGIQVEDATEVMESAIQHADVIITVTTSSTPLFDGNLVRSGAIVAAVGQHGLDAREVDAELVVRSDVMLESRSGMLREGGDIIPARSAKEWEEIHPSNLQDAVRGNFTRTPGKPALFAGVGMSWEDLVLASIVYKNA